MIIKEALANGRLGPRAPAAELAAAASELGSTPDAVALAAVLAQPFADVVLSGVATRDTLASNLAAAELALSDEVLGGAGAARGGQRGVLEHALRAALELS